MLLESLDGAMARRVGWCTTRIEEEGMKKSALFLTLSPKGYNAFGLN
jgi:hypothetical protein